MKKRILSLALAFTLVLSAFSLASCKPSSDMPDGPAKGALTTKSLQNIYKADAVDTTGTLFEKFRIRNVYDMGGNKLLVEGYSQEEGNYEDKYYITDITFKNATEMTIKKAEGENTNTYVQQVAVNPADSSIWYIKNVYTYVETDMEEQRKLAYAVSDTTVSYGSGGEVYIMDSAAEPVSTGESSDQYFLVKVDANGNIVSETDISTLLQTKNEETGETYNGYVQGLLFAGGKMVMNISSEKLYLINTETGAVDKEVPLDGVDYVENLFTGASGDVYYSSWGENGMEMYKLDLETGKSEKAEFKLTGQLYNYQFATGKLGYEFLLADSNALYGYNPTDEQPTEICNYVNSDIDTRYRSVAPIILDDGRMLLSYYDYENRSNEVMLLSKVDPSQVKEKYVITLGARYLNYDLKSALMKFNRTNDEYKIVFKLYNQYDNEENEYKGGAQQLEQDLLAGGDAAPDLIVIDTDGMDYESYISKGILADLEKFMDADESFNKEDYLDNVFEAMKIGGKLYTMTPTVEFMTMTGKKSVFGDKTHWNMKDFLDMHNSLGEGEQMLDEATRDGIGQMFLIIAKDEFIEDSGKCNFNTEDFQNILAYLKDLPADYTAYQNKWEENPNYWEEREQAYSKGLTKLRPLYIYNFDVIPEAEAYMGEEVTFIGYPSSKEDSVGAMIMPTQEIAINANSKVASGAWEALKYLLSDEYQNRYSGDDENGNSWEMPMKKSVIEKKMVNDLKPRYYTDVDENGEEIQVEQDRTTWIADQEVEIRKSTEEDVQRLYDVITKANVVVRLDNKMTDIILNDAQPYFDGQKSAAEVANIINSRVQLMVNERK